MSDRKMSNLHVSGDVRVGDVWLGSNNSPNFVWFVGNTGVRDTNMISINGGEP